MNKRATFAGALLVFTAGCGSMPTAKAQTSLSSECQRKYVLTSSDISSQQSEALCTCAATKFENEHGPEITILLTGAYEAWNQSIAAGVDPTQGPEGHERAGYYLMPFGRMVLGCALETSVQGKAKN